MTIELDRFRLQLVKAVIQRLNSRESASITSAAQRCASPPFSTWLIDKANAAPIFHTVQARTDWLKTLEAELETSIAKAQHTMTKLELLKDVHARIASGRTYICHVLDEMPSTDASIWLRKEVTTALRGHNTFNVHATEQGVTGHAYRLAFLQALIDKETAADKPSGHPHAELMAQYAEDAKTSLKPWRNRQGKRSGGWFDLSTHPEWADSSDYRRKPKTVKIGDVEIQAPNMNPSSGQWVWSLREYSENFRFDRDRESHRQLRDLGWLFDTQEAAAAAADAVSKLLKG